MALDTSLLFVPRHVRRRRSRPMVGPGQSPPPFAARVATAGTRPWRARQCWRVKEAREARGFPNAGVCDSSAGSRCWLGGGQYLMARPYSFDLREREVAAVGKRIQRSICRCGSRPQSDHLTANLGHRVLWLRRLLWGAQWTRPGGRNGRAKRTGGPWPKAVGPICRDQSREADANEVVDQSAYDQPRIPAGELRPIGATERRGYPQRRNRSSPGRD